MAGHRHGHAEQGQRAHAGHHQPLQQAGQRPALPALRRAQQQRRQHPIGQRHRLRPPPQPRRAPQQARRAGYGQAPGGPGQPARRGQALGIHRGHVHQGGHRRGIARQAQRQHQWHQPHRQTDAGHQLSADQQQIASLAQAHHRIQRRRQPGRGHQHHGSGQAQGQGRGAQHPAQGTQPAQAARLRMQRHGNVGRKNQGQGCALLQRRAQVIAQGQVRCPLGIVDDPARRAVQPGRAGCQALAVGQQQGHRTLADQRLQRGQRAGVQHDAALGAGPPAGGQMGLGCQHPQPQQHGGCGQQAQQQQAAGPVGAGPGRAAPVGAQRAIHPA